MKSKRTFIIDLIMMAMSIILFIITVITIKADEPVVLIQEELNKEEKPTPVQRNAGAAVVLDEPFTVSYELTYEVKEKTTYLGEFKLTAYCSCSKCCGKWADNRPVDENGDEIVVGSTGERLTANYSIAVDPKVIPYGTVVEINGHDYKAQDCGGGIKGNRIDVYFNDHQEALKFGRQKADVYIKEVYCE